MAAPDPSAAPAPATAPVPGTAPTPAATAAGTSAGGPVRVRIAPSPTGDPHVGTAYVALFNKALARRQGGQFILRIEDTDRARYQAGSEHQIHEALRWLGLDPDEGPEHGGAFAPYRQSERTDIYRRAVDDLLARGGAYRCFCSAADLDAMRERQRAAKLPTGYDGTCRRLPAAEAAAKLASGQPYVVRMAVPEGGKTTFEDGLRGVIEIDHTQVDDQVLLKSDGFPTYHLANVVDDHAMQITHVIRAEEWISSTPKHVLLYQAYGWQAPRFYHLPLLRNADKSKISKRKNPTSLVWYRAEGFLPEALLNFLGLMGYSLPDGREMYTFAEFVEGFDLARLKVTGPIFDLKKLEWLNGEWMRRLAPADFLARIHGFFGDRYAARPDLAAKVAPLIQERIKKLNEWPQYADTFFAGLPEYPAADLASKKVDAAKAAAILDGALARVEGTEPFTAAALDAAFRPAAEEAGLQVGPYFMVLRVAVTGRTVSTPLFETMEVLGRAETLTRLRVARAKLA